MLLYNTILRYSKMVSRKIGTLSGLMAAVLSLGVLPIAQANPTVSRPSQSATIQAKSQVAVPMQIIFLYVNGSLVDCSYSCSYVENHVFDICSGEVIGYVNPASPNTIIGGQGQVVGYLLSFVQ
jgi:hypothetical protein